MCLLLGLLRGPGGSYPGRRGATASVVHSCGGQAVKKRWDRTVMQPGASVPNYERSSAALMPASTAARMSAGSAPSRRVSLARPSVVSWWHTAMPSPRSPPAPSGIGTAVGRSSYIDAPASRCSTPATENPALPGDYFR